MRYFFAILTVLLTFSISDASAQRYSLRHGIHHIDRLYDGPVIVLPDPCDFLEEDFNGLKANMTSELGRQAIVPSFGMYYPDTTSPLCDALAQLILDRSKICDSPRERDVIDRMQEYLNEQCNDY